MPTIVVETKINASVEHCFDLARDMGLHCQSLAKTGEKLVAGVTSGLIGMGQFVTFEAVHFGIRQRLTAQITAFDFPNQFTDEMTQGAFASLKHIHEFFPQETGTLMRDTMRWNSPLGMLGLIADMLFLKRYMTRTLTERGAFLKQVAERQTESK